MSMDEDSAKMEQSSRITRIGCFGAVLLLILLILIGLVSVRADIQTKRAAAVSILARMTEQVNKAPDILNRMLAWDCAIEAGESVDQLESFVTALPDEPTVEQLEIAWDAIENSRSLISRGCTSSMSELAFVDLTTELEGAKNRYAVEKGNFANAAEIYNLALDSFPGFLVASGFSKF